MAGAQPVPRVSNERAFPPQKQLRNVREAFRREMGTSISVALNNAYVYYVFTACCIAVFFWVSWSTPLSRQVAFMFGGYCLDQASFGLFHMHVHSLFIETDAKGADVRQMPSYAQAGYYHHYYLDAEAIHGIGIEMCMFGIVYGQPSLILAWLLPAYCFGVEHTLGLFVYFFLFHSLQQPVHYWYHARGKRPLWFRALEAIGVTSVQTHRVDHHGHQISQLERVEDWFDLHAVVPFLPRVSDWLWKQSSSFTLDGASVRSKAFKNSASLVFVFLLFGTLWATQEFFTVFDGAAAAGPLHQAMAVLGVLAGYLGAYLVVYCSTVAICLALSWQLEKKRITKLK